MPAETFNNEAQSQSFAWMAANVYLSCISNVLDYTIMTIKSSSFYEPRLQLVPLAGAWMPCYPALEIVYAQMGLVVLNVILSLVTPVMSRLRTFGALRTRIKMLRRLSRKTLLLKFQEATIMAVSGEGFVMISM